MDNILNLRFSDNPSPGDAIEFMYSRSGGEEYETIRILFVSIGNRLNIGEFEIQETLEDTIQVFIEHFINDFQLEVSDVELFNIKLEREDHIQIENILGGFSDLIISSPSGNIEGDLTSTTIEGINEITLIFSNNPSDGDEVRFQYYPDYPDISTTNTIELRFVSETPTNTGDIPIGSGLDETYRNIVEWFGRYYNNNGEFEIYLSDYSGDTGEIYLSIRASNSSTFKDLTSTINPEDVEIEEVSRPISEQRMSEFILVKSPKMVYNTSSSNYKRFRFSLRLLSNPSVGSSIMFNLKQNDINKIFYLKYFRTSESSNNDVIIGPNVNDTMNNLYNNLNEHNSSDLVQYEINNNTIYIDIYDGDENEYSIDMLNNDANIEYYGPVVDGGVRGYDHTVFNVSEWEGMMRQITEYAGDISVKWVIDKQLISEDQFQTYINVSPLINNRLKSNLGVYTSKSNVLPMPQGSGKWVSVSARNMLVDLNRDVISRTYYALDGWSEDGFNIVPRVLLVGGEYKTEYGKPVRYIRRSLHRGSVGRIHYQTRLHNGSVDVIGNNNTMTIENTSGNPLNSREFIKSVRIPYMDSSNQPFSQTVTMVFGYSSERFPSVSRQDYFSTDNMINPLTIETTKVIIDIIDECKYPVVEVIFKNRYGVLETVTFGKVSKRELKTTREDFSSSVVDINGIPNLNTHNKKPFNINGQEEYTLNTGFVKEYMNEVYTDLFMSDEIYLKCESINRFVPVNLMDNDFNRMKRINVGLINYTFRFQTSYNKNYNYS